MTTTQAAQVEVVKAAPKAAQKKGASKPAPKASQKAKAAPKAKGPSFALMAGGARPGAGDRLKAHTQAVLELYGMDKGAAVEKAQLRKVVGDQAIRYNVDKGAFKVEGGKVSLTEQGAAFFKERLAKLDSAIIQAYKDVLTKGEPVELVCKNKEQIVAL